MGRCGISAGGGWRGLLQRQRVGVLFPDPPGVARCHARGVFVSVAPSRVTPDEEPGSRVPVSEPADQADWPVPVVRILG